MRRLLLMTTLLGLVSTAALAADNPWLGTWKLDLAKSHLSGDTFTVTKTNAGLYHFSDGGTIHFDFAIDGKEYPSAYNHTQSWTAAGERAWDSVVKAEGKVLAKVHRELSADGKTLTVSYVSPNPDGTTTHSESVYTRTSGESGLLGHWRSTQVTATNPDSYVITAPAPGTLHWEHPQDKSTIEAKGDGKDYPVSGPTQPPGITFSYKLDSPRKLSYLVKNHGKPDTYGVQTLSADGKSYTDVSWSAGKENEKLTSVYVKQ